VLDDRLVDLTDQRAEVARQALPLLDPSGDESAGNDKQD